MLVTLRADMSARSQVIELVNLFEGRVVDVGHDELTVSLDGEPDRLDDLEGLLRLFGIVELQRTGRGPAQAGAHRPQPALRAPDGLAHGPRRLPAAPHPGPARLRRAVRRLPPGGRRCRRAVRHLSGGTTIDPRPRHRRRRPSGASWS